MQLAPEFITVWRIKGDVLGFMNRNEEALVCYDRYLKKFPDDPDVLRNRCVTLLRLKRADEALASITKALEIKPESEDLLEVKEICMEHLKRQ